MFPALTAERVRELSDSYFGTFNMAYPILDQHVFVAETLPPLLADGFSYGDVSVILALLVLALGELAIEGISGDPVTSASGTSIGLRGGTLQNPPGIELFNEARVSSPTRIQRRNRLSTSDSSLRRASQVLTFE
jgi:hypothetical protein